MSVLRTRRLVSIGLVVFTGLALFHMSSFLLNVDLDLNYSTDSGSLRSPDRNRPLAPSTLIQSLVPSDHRASKNHGPKDLPVVSSTGSKATLKLPQNIPKPTTILDPAVKYLAFMTYAGITNQFMALENAAYVALRLNRTLVIPPITTNSHDKFNSNQRWSEFFDLPLFKAQTGLAVVEWNDIRPLTAAQIEVGQSQVRKGYRAFPVWDSLADNITCQIIYGFGDSERLHTTELTFARQFLLRPQFVRPPPRKNTTKVFDRSKIGAKDNINLEDVVTVDDLVDRYADNTDQLVFLSHTFKLKDPLGRRSWSAAGQHFHFLPKIKEFATRLIQSRVPETKHNNGRYIAIHVRRGDIWQKCRSKSEAEMSSCIIPLGYYAESVEKAFQILGERLPVVVATDSKSEDDHITMAKLGWRRLDHDQYTTEDEVGIFGPALVDALILADAEVMIGSYTSSMSRVAARRQKSWHQHNVLYPKTTISLIPTP